MTSMARAADRRATATRRGHCPAPATTPPTPTTTPTSSTSPARGSSSSPPAPPAGKANISNATSKYFSLQPPPICSVLYGGPLLEAGHPHQLPHPLVLHPAHLPHHPHHLAPFQRTGTLPHNFSTGTISILSLNFNSVTTGWVSGWI